MPRITAWIALVLLTIITGCGDADRNAASEADGPGLMDTLNAGAYDGLSRQQIERRAEPVTASQAERLDLPTLDPDSAVPSPP